MPIRPIDMQVAIPKMSEVSRMSQLEQQRAGLQSDQSGVAAGKSNQREASTVMQSQKDSGANNQADAKEKGKNAYSKRQPNPRKPKDQDKKKVVPRSENKIDIRI